ncbi:MAG TPA: amino acid adenylation domain-containing protein, partial [Blastocatellia bacterium]
MAGLRKYLKEKLPEYMTPSAIVALEKMPLTPNGKLDRKALPAPDSSSYITSEYEAPVGEPEIALARIWAEVLGIERVGRNDHFFEQGGHSLLAVRLVERMRSEGLHTDVRGLFSNPTVAALAAAVGGESDKVEVPPNRIPFGCEAIKPEMLPLAQLSADDIERIVSRMPGGAANVQDVYPLAPLQEGILFHHQMSPEGDMYLMRGLLSFDTRTRMEGFLQALQAVIERHDLLRTAVFWEGLPEPVQVVYRRAQLEVEEVNVDPTVSDVAEELYARFDPRRYRLDVRRAPLMCVRFAYDGRNDRWVALHLVHHLVMDHTTLEVLLREIQAHLSGQAEQLLAPPPFRNFVAQARLVVSREEHEAFFRGMLGDVDEPTAPFGLINAQGAGPDIREARRKFDTRLANRLRQESRALGVSAASLYHLAWAQVLARVSGREDVIFGTVLLGRMQGGEGADRVLGMFINTLPIRIRIGGASLRESVLRTHTLLADLLRHQHAPLALAQRCSAVEAPAPLFSALLNYRHSTADGITAGAAERSLPAWDGIEILAAEERTNYPLTLVVDDLGEGFSLTAQSQSSIDPGRICAYMHTALETLVKALESAPATSVRSLDVLPHSERRQLLVEWNATETSYPSYQCVHELFEVRAADNPEAVAVACEDAQLTYGELNAQADRLAHYLSAIGVKPDARVALLVERSLEMIVGLLGILKAGGAYVPLDPTYPAERLAYMLEDSAPAVVLTHNHVRAEIRSALAKAGVPMIDLEAEAGRRANEAGASRDKSAVGLTPERLAYVIYTSGSTGRPKGVMNEHRGVVNRLLWMQDAYGLTEDDAVLQKTPFGFDVSVWEFFWPLLNGARLVVARPEGHKDPAYLTSVIEQEGITTLHFVPSMLQVFLESGEAGRCSSLARVICSGEALPGSLVRRFRQRLSAARLYNLYGPTEAAVDVTAWDCAADTGQESIPIGRPIANTQIYLLDRNGEPAPVGVTGEIHIGGVQVARGYLNRAELTAERFVACPFGGDGNSRMYKTGDLGRYLPDGNIEYLGRNDFQVKIRGFRIEIGEVETRLAQHPAIREAVVLAREDVSGALRLVAYYTRTTAEDSAVKVDAESLRAHLLAALPEYMVPAAYIALDALPTTPNGKLDRKALPEPGQDRGEGGVFDISSRTPAEEILAGTFAEVLGLDHVGPRDNFFELGGHSLSATQVISRVMKTFGAEISVRAIFEDATVEGLASRIERAIRAGEKDEAPPLVRVARDGQREVRAPLSFAQQRLWFLDQLAPNNPFYNISGAVSLEGKFDLEALERSVNEIVRRHEALRTKIVVEAGTPVQVIEEWAQRRLEIEDLTGLVQEEREEKARTAMKAEAGTGFDLGRGPLLRARVLKLEEEKHLALFTMHHIVSDGWSMGVLAREVCEIYEAMAEGREASLPELEVQYADYAVWQKSYLDGRLLDDEVGYWKKRLKDAAVMELPTDRARPPAPSYRGARERVAIDNSLSEGLRRLCRREGVTTFMTLMAALKVLLMRYSGEDDVSVGTVIANRTRKELEGLIGFFANTLVMRTDLGGNPSFRELMEREREVCLGAYGRQELPFEKLVEEINPDRDLSRSPLFQVMMALQNAGREELKIKGLKVCEIEGETGAAKFDLLLTLTEGEGGFVGSLEYSLDLYDGETVRRMARHYEKVLAEIVRDASQRIRELELMSAEEKEQVIVEFNRTERPYDTQLCIHELIEAQAEIKGDDIAV